jgi:hypothetical protein
MRESGSRLKAVEACAVADVGTNGSGGLYRIVYDSVVAVPFGDAGDRDIRALLEVARSRNAGLGITGALFCDGAYFVQLLEGPVEAVEVVFASIQADPRHTDIRVVERGPAETRWFASWHMAMVTEAQVAQMRRTNPDLPALQPYRTAELVATLSEVLAPHWLPPRK